MILRQSLKYLKPAKIIPQLASNRLIRYKASTESGQSPAEADRDYEEISINRQLSRNIGLNRFMHKVYRTTGLSILAALATPYALLSMPISSAGIYFLAKAGIVGTLVGFFGTALTSPQYETKRQKLSHTQTIETLVAKNSIMRQLLFGTGILGLGLSITPMIGMINVMDPTILPTALGITLAIFGGASLVAFNMRKGSLLSYGKVLGGSLFGLICLQLVGIGSLFFTGPNPFAYMLLNASTYISAGLFTAFVAYDTHLAVKMYEQNMPDSLGLAANFVLDFWNIFVSILRMLSNQNQ